MGWRSARLFVLIICILQVIVVIENQVFNFLSFMYGPIIANFLHMMFIVFGFFGAWDCSKKYIRVFIIWNIFWMGWNVFVICFYLDVGLLDKDSSMLNLGTGGRSWWEIHGVGCIADFTSAGNGSSLEQDPDPSGPFRPTKVEGCVMEYQYVEVLQASVQCLLGVLGIIGGIFMTKMNKEDDDSFQIKEPQGHPTRPLHFTYQTSRGHLDQYQQQILANGYGPRSVSPRPMTPRRVKRRSILARDTMNRSSLNHRRQGSSRSRSSQRRARPHQNPVTRLLEQQNRFLDPSVISTSFNDSNTSNYLAGREDGKDFETAYRFKSGLNNPVFQQSSNSSLNQSGADEIYRPNSARSSYSNYHASRPVSYLHNNEYFSNQAVAQVPISTNRSKGLQRNEETQNNLHPNKTTATLKSFSQKNFNFLGFNLKNNNVNNNNNNNTNSNINNNFSNNYNNNRNVYSMRSDGTVRNSKRFRVDLTRSRERTSNVFFSQGPPAYREGGLDSETVI